ncbi:MAG: hypothetical protein WC915_06815 [archaeon]|jgi:hypothetical protein
MKKMLFLIFIIITTLILLGCTQTDLTQLAMYDSSVQQFMEEHPNAEISINLYNSQQTQTLKELLPKCNNIEEKDYYLVEVNDTTMNLNLKVLINKDTQETICAYQEGTTIPQTNDDLNQIVLNESWITAEPFGIINVSELNNNGYFNVEIKNNTYDRLVFKLLKLGLTSTSASITLESGKTYTFSDNKFYGKCENGQFIIPKEDIEFTYNTQNIENKKQFANQNLIGNCSSDNLNQYPDIDPNGPSKIWEMTDWTMIKNTIGLKIKNTSDEPQELTQIELGPNTKANLKNNIIIYPNESTNIFIQQPTECEIGNTYTYQKENIIITYNTNNINDKKQYEDQDITINCTQVNYPDQDNNDQEIEYQPIWTIIETAMQKNMISLTLKNNTQETIELTKAQLNPELISEPFKNTLTIQPNTTTKIYIQTPTDCEIGNTYTYQKENIIITYNTNNINDKKQYLAYDLKITCTPIHYDYQTDTNYCVDSDNSYFIQGTTQGYPDTIQGSTYDCCTTSINGGACQDEGPFLSEAICYETHPSRELIMCENGCKNGKCIP